MLLVAVGRFSSGGVAICYVLPVLWMTSCFHTTGPMGRYLAICYRWKTFPILCRYYCNYFSV